MKVKNKTIISTACGDKQERLEQIHNVQPLPVSIKLGGYHSIGEKWYPLSDAELSAFYTMAWDDDYDLTAVIEGVPAIWGDITILFQRREKKESSDFLPTTAPNPKVREIAYTKVTATAADGTVIDLCEDNDYDHPGWSSLKEVTSIVEAYFGKKGNGIYAYCPIRGEFLPRLPFNTSTRHGRGLNAVYNRETKKLIGFDYMIDNTVETRKIIEGWEREKR
jgi:hypothetical protein